MHAHMHSCLPTEYGVIGMRYARMEYVHAAKTGDKFTYVDEYLCFSSLPPGLLDHLT